MYGTLCVTLSICSSKALHGSASHVQVSRTSKISLEVFSEHQNCLRCLFISLVSSSIICFLCSWYLCRVQCDRCRSFTSYKCFCCFVHINPWFSEVYRLPILCILGKKCMFYLQVIVKKHKPCNFQEGTKHNHHASCQYWLQFCQCWMHACTFGTSSYVLGNEKDVPDVSVW